MNCYNSSLYVKEFALEHPVEADQHHVQLKVLQRLCALSLQHDVEALSVPQSSEYRDLHHDQVVIDILVYFRVGQSNAF